MVKLQIRGEVSSTTDFIPTSNEEEEFPEDTPQAYFFQNAFCVPSSCSPESTVEFLNSYFLYQTSFVAKSADCQILEEPELESVDVATL